MNRIVHFEIHSDDLQRAKTFYQEVFGWQFEKWEGGNDEYWMIMTAERDSKEPGINGGLLKRTEKLSKQAGGANAFVCTIVVDDFDAMANRILKAGGAVAVPKHAIASMAWQGYFIDTENNTFGIHQPDPNAR